MMPSAKVTWSARQPTLKGSPFDQPSAFDHLDVACESKGSDQGWAASLALPATETGASATSPR